MCRLLKDSIDQTSRVIIVISNTEENHRPPTQGIIEWITKESIFKISSNKKYGVILNSTPIVNFPAKTSHKIIKAIINRFFITKDPCKLSKWGTIKDLIITSSLIRVNQANTTIRKLLILSLAWTRLCREICNFLSPLRTTTKGCINIIAINPNTHMVILCRSRINVRNIFYKSRRNSSRFRKSILITFKTQIKRITASIWNATLEPTSIMCINNQTRKSRKTIINKKLKGQIRPCISNNKWLTGIASRTSKKASQ